MKKHTIQAKHWHSFRGLCARMECLDEEGLKKLFILLDVPEMQIGAMEGMEGAQPEIKDWFMQMCAKEDRRAACQVRTLMEELIREGAVTLDPPEEWNGVESAQDNPDTNHCRETPGNRPTGAAIDGHQGNEGP